MRTNFDKNLVFIVSGGRTGTTFFGEVLSHSIDDCFSVHEPDLLAPRFDPEFIKKLKIFGVRHMLFDRALGKTGIRNLNFQFQSQSSDADEFVKRIYAHRLHYYQQIEESLIIESYYQWYGLLPVILKAFPKAKIVAIVRDPRNWVRSWMNFTGLRDNSELFRIFGQRRLSPTDVGDKLFIEKWAIMDRFERICWDWRFINQKIFDASKLSNRVLMLRFEDLFDTVNEKSTMDKLLEFICAFDNKIYANKFDYENLKKPINRSTGAVVPRWPDWPPDLSVKLDNICGPLMRRLNYGEESDWCAVLASSKAAA